jgi:hypothetical protein
MHLKNVLIECEDFIAGVSNARQGKQYYHPVYPAETVPYSANMFQGVYPGANYINIELATFSF